jgi:hypothetical protein
MAVAPTRVDHRPFPALPLLADYLIDGCLLPGFTGCIQGSNGKPVVLLGHTIFAFIMYIYVYLNRSQNNFSFPRQMKNQQLILWSQNIRIFDQCSMKYMTRVFFIEQNRKSIKHLLAYRCTLRKKN